LHAAQLQYVPLYFVALAGTPLTPLSFAALYFEQMPETAFGNLCDMGDWSCLIDAGLGVGTLQRFYQVAPEFNLDILRRDVSVIVRRTFQIGVQAVKELPESLI
jgi:hypothetical protein